MPVVNKKSNLFAANVAPKNAPSPQRARGVAQTATFEVTNASTDSANSTYLLATVPAEALWDEATSFKVDGWGFATVSIGTLTDIDALVTVLKSAGTYVNPVLVGDAKHGLPIWQALGLSAAPANGMIDIYAHAPANATGAGVLKGKISYRSV